MNEKAAPIAAIVSDISCYGRAALTSSIAVLAAMGVQCAPMPTAVLSSHTGGFGKPAKADLTDFLRPCAEHWQKIGVPFSAIATGYFANLEQADAAAEFLAQYTCLKIVDPVMGDHGKMYSSLPAEMPERMRALARGAIVTPNRTEAALLTGLSMDDPGDKLLEALLQKTQASCALIKGVDGANIWMDAADGKMHALPFESEPGAYPGTGDLFAAVLLGALLQGKNMARAVETAADFVREAVARTNRLGTDSRCGVQFEGILHKLTVCAHTDVL